MIKEIKHILESINPMLNLELSEAEIGHINCEQDLLEAYANYEESVVRLKRIKKRLKAIK